MATVLTLTGLIPTIYEAMDVISREQVGFIPAVSRDSKAEQAALGDDVTSPVVGAMAAEDLTVGNVAADGGNQTISTVKVTMSKARSVPFGISGEDTKRLQNGGTLGTINRDRIVQAMRTLTNEIEADLAALYVNASRAYGTANVVPFGTAGDHTDFAGVNKLLDDNGAPVTDRQLVLGSGAIANIRGKQSGLFEVNRAGDSELLRRGSLGQPVQGLDLHQSSQILGSRPVGTSNSAATTNTAGYAIGATVITLASAGTGSLIAGDIITFAGDTEKYVLAAGDTDTSNGGTITLQEPGLRKAIPASATAITLIATTTRNAAFHRSAIQLATRAPAMPEGGDAADDVMYVEDPVSGMTYEFVIYRQKRQVRYEVNMVWGVKVTAPRHFVTLIGQ
jgi:hypothetical protein